MNVQGKGECRAACYCSWRCDCVCHHLGPVLFVLQLHCCCATSAFSNTSSPTGFTQGTCNLSNKALFVCVCLREREKEGEGGNSLPYKGFTDAFLLENEASGKSCKCVCVFFKHFCDLWFVLLPVFLKISVLCGNTRAQRNTQWRVLCLSLLW